MVFQDPVMAAQGLEELLVPGLAFGAHVPLMVDAFKARGLVLSHATLYGAGFYVYLKEPAAAPSSFDALHAQHVLHAERQYLLRAGWFKCDCGMCWTCGLTGMGLEHVLHMNIDW